MTELLHELLKVPLFAPIIILIILVGTVILALFAKNYDNNHNGKNPYVLAMIILSCLEVVLILGINIRYGIIKSNIYEYVTIKKENDEIIVKSTSTFVKNKTFKIKETVNNINIIEYNGKEFIIRNQQLQ